MLLQNRCVNHARKSKWFAARPILTTLVYSQTRQSYMDSRVCRSEQACIIGTLVVVLFSFVPCLAFKIRVVCV